MQLVSINRCAIVVKALAVILTVMAAPAARGAAPIEVVVAECAATELGQDDARTCVAAGCSSACDQNGHCARCSQHFSGRDVCCPTMEEVTEEKTCWNVKCEKVCIPSVRMPWQPGGSRLTLFNWLCLPEAKCRCGSCCAPRCGTVRCVSVLESDSYEVTSCRCKWEIRRLPSCRDADGCGEMISATSLDEDEAGDSILPMPTP